MTWIPAFLLRVLGPGSRIQDFTLGATEPLVGGAPTSDADAFRWNVCENERIESCWGGGRLRHPLDPPMAGYHDPGQGGEILVSTEIWFLYGFLFTVLQMCYPDISPP